MGIMENDIETTIWHGLPRRKIWNASWIKSAIMRSRHVLLRSFCALSKALWKFKALRRWHSPEPEREVTCNVAAS